jgi:hypothetical protein
MAVKGTRKRSSFSVPLVFASFFGAAMIGIAFAYFNFKFSEYKFINFKDWVLYEKSQLFVPKHKYYTLLIYNSKVKMPEDILNLKKQSHPLIAIDFAQEKFESDANVSYLTAPTNTLLKIIQRFNIYAVPSVIIIKQFKDNLYKQDSMITIVD